MSDSSPTTKKRKANDGRATVSHRDGGGGLFSSWLGYFTGRRGDGTSPTAQTTCGGENLTQEKIDTMMQMMSRMEEKCSRLETECNSLKTMLKRKMEQDDCKFDSLVKQNEYNTMLVRNQSWEYSAPVRSVEHWENNGFNGEIAFYLTDSSACLKGFAEKMRRGEFPAGYDGIKGINLNWNEDDPILDPDSSMIMYPHWLEFTEALKQFTPAFGVLPDDCATYFNIGNVQLTGSWALLLKHALMNKPFQKLHFVNRADVGDDEGMSVDAILEIMNSNEHLRKLTIGNTLIGRDNMAKICSIVRFGSIVDLDLRNCFENGLGDTMMTSLLKRCGFKLERLGLASNRITPSEITLLSDFLATNPLLEDLDLDGNRLIDNDAEALSNALRGNSRLRRLDLCNNAIDNVGKEAFRLVLYDESSLNSIADTNHSCGVHIAEFPHFNCYSGEIEPPNRFNRARKIFDLLSVRNRSMSNVQYFDEIDVKLLPFMLTAMPLYASMAAAPGGVAALSLVYEVMRKWDKVFPLYADGGNKGSI